MNRKEVYQKSEQLLTEFEETVKPYLKSSTIYSPAEVSVLCNFVSELALYIFYYELASEDLTQDERLIHRALDEAEQTIHEVLNEKEQELEQQEPDYVFEDDNDDQDEMGGGSNLLS